ncbi:hypothetical protein [Umezawaea tangerina]|uniref:ATP/GTP-binding protein n=1 Tax=Umezawaea tangerina TaxID=84725 RepID=A0A2T0S6Z5_9PSEU|nr:hypothetical protein [Umezawaea tangerina]PRY29201.1 hypothetical protein CLV43_12678 [Umezawaea tangerina]
MLIKTVLAVALLLCSTTTSAVAEPWGNVNCGQHPTPVCDLAAGTVPTNGQQPGRPAEPVDSTGDAADEYSDCRYKPVDRPNPPDQPEESGGWFMVLCSPDGKDPLSHGPVWIAEGGTPPPPSPEQVARVAYEKLRLPQLAIFSSPVGDQLVNLPTWLWLASGWEAVNATAAVPGVSATATATPTAAAWSLGDGTTVTCAVAGTPYSASTDPAAPSPDCGHTYRRSSADQAGQAFAVTATVRWTVTWSGAGQSGTFPDLTTTGTASFRVAESQALNNGG